MTTNEDAALYAALHSSADEVFSIVSVEDFTFGNYQSLATIIDSSRESVDQVNLAQHVMAEALRRGTPPPDFVTQIATCGILGTATYWANKVRDDSLRRRFGMAMQRGMQMSEHEDIHETLLTFKAEYESLIRDSQFKADPEVWSLNDLMGMNVEERRFTIPSLLARSERLVLTGVEGGGKSVLVYQLLTSAAYGVDSFTNERYEPQRVLFVDVENSSFQQRDALMRVVPMLTELAPDVTPNWLSLKRRVFNLLATRDKADLIRQVVHYNPDILYLGTAYKLADDSDDTHRSVRAIQSTVDRIRSEIDCSVIIEHHAGHGTANDRNGMRPEGSSFWRRWPDFGKGMLPKVIPGDQRRFMLLKSWRGNRTKRDWPVAFIEDSLFPWRPVFDAEYEQFFERHFGDPRA